MKKLRWAISLALLALLAIGTFLSAPLCSKSFKKKTAAKLLPVLEHKPFVFIIPSYNNSEWATRNLRSIFEQKYDNYRVIYIDDASTDNTLVKVEALVKEFGQEHRTEIRHNATNRGGVENIYRAVHSCHDHEIVILCDGDDWLSHERVLRRLNEIYADAEVWGTFGSYIEYPSYSYTVANFARPLPSHVIKKNKIREFSKEHWCLSHMRTFYAGLFKQIKLKDLLFEGKYYDVAYDIAFMVPIAEMAGKHFRFVDEVFYIYNRATPLNDNKLRAQRQRQITGHILALPTYPPVKAPAKASDCAGVDLIAFSYNRPLQLFALLESLHVYGRHLQSIHVVFRADGSEYLEGYEQVKRAYPAVDFVQQSEKAHGDFKPLVMGLLSECHGEFVAFAVDDIILTDKIDFLIGAQSLKKTDAYAFFYRLGKGVDYCYLIDKQQSEPPLMQVDSDLYAWGLDKSEGDWKYQNSLDLVLYRKANVMADWNKLTFVHPNSLEAAWDKKGKRGRLGLCHARPKMVNIPLNIVNVSDNRHMNGLSVEELLVKFNQGLKIDITPLYQINNRSAHIEYDLQLIDRDSKIAY